MSPISKLLSFKKITNPVILQVGGSNPSELAEACKISEEYGYKEINLNLGCPSKKVQKNKWLRNFEYNQSIVGEWGGGMGSMGPWPPK